MFNGRTFILFIICSSKVCKAMDCGGTQVSRTIVVDQSGKSDFHTIQAAIDSIKTSNNKWVKIHIKAGTYTYVIYSILLNLYPNKLLSLS